MASPEEKLAVRALLDGVQSPVIVELGAFEGEESAWLRKFDPSRYVMVEADPRLSVKLQDFPGASIYRGAIAAHVGSIVLNLCDNATGQGRAQSSILAPSPDGHLKYFPWCTFPKQKEVPCWTLDWIFFREQLDRIDLLWVDIQGAERAMIQGGTEALKRTRWLMMEAEEVEFYEGQALRPELLAMLPGWKMLASFGANVLMENANAIHEG